MGNSQEEPSAVEAQLFAGQELRDADKETLFGQYRMFVETSEALVARRQGVNTFFLSVNSAILAVVGLLLRDGESADLESAMIVGLGLVGVALCSVWRRLIKSFGQLNTAKFAVILAIEKRLPARMFAAEWASLEHGTMYASFTETECRTARVLAVFQSLLVAAGIWLLVGGAS